MMSEKDKTLIEMIPESMHEAVYEQLKEKFDNSVDIKPTQQEIKKLVDTIMR